MLLIILLFLVVVHKYVSLKENFFCSWDGKTQGAITERDQRRKQYYAEEGKLKKSLEAVKNKRDTIEAENDTLEKTYIDAEQKYGEILAENESLIQDLNETTIKSERCESFNKLKLNAIKKIYS